MKPIEEITQEIFEAYKEDLNVFFSEYARCDDPFKKKMISEEITNKAYSIIEYMRANYNYKRLEQTDFYDAYEAMIQRAFRNYNPEKGVFWNYFINGLGYKKREQEKIKAERNEVSIVTAEENNENYQPGTISEEKTESHESAEDEFFSRLAEKEKLGKLNLKGYADYNEMLISVYREMATAIIRIKEGLTNDKRRNKNTGIMFHAFFTSDNVDIIRNGAEAEKPEKEQKAKKTEKEEKVYIIESIEVLRVMNKAPEEYYSELDEKLLDFTYIKKPLTINEIAENALKTNKEILGDGCNDADKTIKVPFEQKSILAAYFSKIWGIDQSYGNINRASHSYKELLGKYAVFD